MFASVWVKDYVIDLDGKPYTVKGERWLGIVNRKDGQPTGKEPYFSGMAYDWDEKKTIIFRRCRNHKNARRI